MTQSKLDDVIDRTKSKWFDKCSLCGIEKQLSTVQLTGKGIYSLWLRRMCEDCRSKTCFYFYLGMGFDDTADMFRKKIKETKK